MARITGWKPRDVVGARIRRRILRLCFLGTLLGMALLYLPSCTIEYIQEEGTATRTTPDSESTGGKAPTGNAVSYLEEDSQDPWGQAVTKTRQEEFRAEEKSAETSQLAARKEREGAAGQRGGEDFLSLPPILAEGPGEATPGSDGAAGSTSGDLDVQSALEELSEALNSKRQEEPHSKKDKVGRAVTPTPESAKAPALSRPREVALASVSETTTRNAAQPSGGSGTGGVPAHPPRERLEEKPPAKEQPRPPRPPGNTVFYTFFHKTAEEFVRFLMEGFFDLIEKRHVEVVHGKPRTAIFLGDDAMIKNLTQMANDFDDLELKLERSTIRPRYMDIAVLMESLRMAGLANVWKRVDETITVQEQRGKSMRTISTHKERIYVRTGLGKDEEPPLDVPPKVPYVFEMPSSDPFKIPRQSTGKGDLDQMTIDFNQTSSTEKRGIMVAVGTAEDLERIQAFVDSIDRPARQIMIEVQLIELDANAFSDIGIDSLQTGQRHSILNFAGTFPGEPITQPGLGEDFRRPNVDVPDIVSEGLTYLFDDTSVDLSGRFLATIHALVRKGDAKIKARPKILTLDDRPSILHIGEEVPTFESTGVNRDVTGGNFVEQVNKVATQYVGFTLNMRPKISGEADDEIALQLEVVANQIQGRERVFEEDLLGIPVVARRRFLGQTRVKNHRPIIMGGLIQEQEVEFSAKVPFLGEIPYFGRLFSRVQKQQKRVEIIMVVTPHILSEKGVDRVATPKESIHFDTFDSVLFNDRHIMKGRDVWGIDPITKQPAMVQGEVFTENEVIDLTLLNIVKQRRLVSRLRIFEEYLSEEASRLGWLQRKFPERSVQYWPEAEKEVYFKAATIVIENIKELNADLTYEEVVLPRREIVLPTTPYRMTLSYDRYKTLAEKGTPVLREGRVELSGATVALLHDVAMQRGIRQFANYVEKNGILPEDHGGLRHELHGLYHDILPESTEDDTDDYATFFHELAKARIDFVTIATYFHENLTDRYVVTGPPNIGSFEEDLRNFMKTTVTITERAKRLQELESKWNVLTTDEGPTTALSESEP